MQADIEAWPWQAKLRFVNPTKQVGDPERIKDFCGGSIIDQRWVVTAAHCTESFTSGLALKNFSVLTVAGDAFGIDEVIVHPGYESDSSVDVDNDIALLKLTEPVGQKAQAIPIISHAAESRYAKPEVMATVAGWGVMTSGNKKDTPDELMQVSLPLVGREICRAAMIKAGRVDSKPYRITDNMLCAGYAQGGKDSCQGDSGGPLVIKIPGHGPVLLGVVSWGPNGCARPERYGVYSRVANYTGWIQKHLGKDLTVDLSPSEPDAEPEPAQVSIPTLPLGDRALLIGVDQYKDSRLDLAGGSANDARAMASFLTEVMGFPPDTVLTLTNKAATPGCHPDPY